ncbi:aspartyl-tRNA synthetase [Burkholderia sp. MR1-5-21]
MTLPVDNRSLKRKAAVCIVLAGLTFYGYSLDRSLIPVAGLAALLALAGIGFFIGARRQMALRIDETGFVMVGAVREKPVTRWRDVTDFGVVNIYGNRFIRYQFTEHAQRARVPGGVLLPVNRFAELPLEAVAAMMEACRDTFTTSASPADTLR